MNKIRQPLLRDVGCTVFWFQGYKNGHFLKAGMIKTLCGDKYLLDMKEFAQSPHFPLSFEKFLIH